MNFLSLFVLIPLLMMVGLALSKEMKITGKNRRNTSISRNRFSHSIIISNRFSCALFV